MSGTRVVVLTNQRDFAADVVVDRLQRLGANVSRLNIESARSEAVEPWSPAAGKPRLHDQPTVVWWRQFETDDHPRDLAGLDELLVERAQWRSWVATMCGSRSVWMNDLWAARRAENKVEQLRTAADVGLCVPRTLITNSAAQAAEFGRTVGGAVVKTLSSGYFSFSDQSFVFTELLDDAVLDRVDAWSAAPLVVQQHLGGALDVRVVSFGSRCFGARCRSKGVDWRKTPFDPELWFPWPVPPDIATRCESYRARLGLEFAAFDFMVTDDATYFLEANQAGEWMFLDRVLELGIGPAIADYLIQMGSDGA